MVEFENLASQWVPETLHSQQILFNLQWLLDNRCFSKFNVQWYFLSAQFVNTTLYTDFYHTNFNETVLKVFYM